MANFAAIELNPWTSRGDKPHEPTWALIDIDPGESTRRFTQVARTRRTCTASPSTISTWSAARKSRASAASRSGSRSSRGYSFDDTRTGSRSISRAVGGTLPDLVSWSWRKAERGGLARLDYTQNAINKTLVAPFSVRPAPARRCRFRSRGTRSTTAAEARQVDDPVRGQRLADKGDPLRELIGLQQTLPKL